MKYRTKLYISFIGLIITTSIIGVGFVYFKTRSFLFNELKSKVLSISATTASLINGDLIKDVKEDPNIDSKAFQELRTQLIQVKNINRRDDVFLEYLYSIHRHPNQPDEIVIGVDAAQQEFNFPGSYYEEKKEIGIKDHLEEYYIPKTFIEDRSGEFLTAYSPIIDQSGNFVASMAASIGANVVLGKLHSLMLFGVLAFLCGILLSIGTAYFLSNLMTRSLSNLREDVLKISQGDLNHKCRIETEDEFNHLSSAINHMTVGLQEREKIKSNFAKYISKQVLEKIIESKEEVRLDGQRKQVTVLFSDIIQFSKISEKYHPEKVVTLLNEYFEKMLDVIINYDGTIDKFIGEGIMVEFGAPIDDHEQERKGVKAAIEMHKALKILIHKWKKEDKPEIQICIGIHTGEAVVGNIGSEERLEYTAIGDTVNIASRLMYLCKDQNKKILVSYDTMKKSGIQEEYFEFLGEVQLPGRTKKTLVFSIDPFQGG